MQCARSMGRLAWFVAGQVLRSSSSRSSQGRLRLHHTEGPDEGSPLSAPDSITTLVADHDGVSVVSVSGEIDLVTAPALEQAISAVVAEGPTALVIDLSAVEFLGSVGLKILAATYEKLGGNSRVRCGGARTGDQTPDSPDRSGQDVPVVPDAGRRVDRRAGRQAQPLDRQPRLISGFRIDRVEPTTCWLARSRCAPELGDPCVLPVERKSRGVRARSANCHLCNFFFCISVGAARTGYRLSHGRLQRIAPARQSQEGRTLMTTVKRLRHAPRVRRRCRPRGPHYANWRPRCPGPPRRPSTTTSTTLLFRAARC